MAKINFRRWNHDQNYLIHRQTKWAYVLVGNKNEYFSKWNMSVVLPAGCSIEDKCIINSQMTVKKVVFFHKIESGFERGKSCTFKFYTDFKSVFFLVKMKFIQIIIGSNPLSSEFSITRSIEINSITWTMHISNHLTISIDYLANKVSIGNVGDILYIANEPMPIGWIRIKSRFHGTAVYHIAKSPGNFKQFR